MNVINKFLIPALALGMFAACSDDNKFEGPETPDVAENSVTMKISVQLPTAGGRATNIGDPATEAGSDAENKINNLLLVLADSENGFIDYADADIMEPESGSTSATVNCKATFSISTLSNYISSIANTASVKVFAFCNYSSDFAAHLSTLTKNGKDKNWVNQYATVNSGAADNTGTWTKNLTKEGVGIPMANSEIKSGNLPTVAELPSHNESNPIDLGTVKVERSVARFDFKDASKNNDFTYNIYDEDGEKIDVVIDRIGLVNMSNKYYYLRHTAPNGSSNSVADLGEGKINILNSSDPWVVDVDADEKSKYNGTSVSSNFLFPVTSTVDGKVVPGRNQWYSTAVADFKKDGALEDNEDWNKETGYKVWRYVTENTIPVASLQKNGQSTGVVFKAKLSFTGKDGGIVKSIIDAKNTDNNNKAIYFYKSDKVVPLGTADFILKENNDKLKETYINAFKAAVVENDPTSTASKAKLTEAGFIIFEPATGGTSPLGTEDVAGEYYMYYYYWNRHDDNNEVNVMGPMEFGVVRNHIYKLKITGISGLGHPRKPENDPDPEDPNNPDEEGNVAIQIAVEPVDWSVRVNGIEF